MGKFMDKCRSLCFCCRKKKYVNETENNFDQKDHDQVQGGYENIAYEREPTTIENAKTNTRNRQNEQKLSNVIQTVDFIEQYKDMMSYEDMEREFLDFKTAFRSENTSVSQLAENRGKNRYMNVLPNDNSRVKLITSENNYINANYISIKDEVEYIATQGPLPGTKEDFWNMIWNENTRSVVMLTQLVENGKIKCDQYWPFDEAKEQLTNSLEIEKNKENVTPFWTEREFYVSNENESRKIKQFHLTSWQQSEIPTNMNDFVSFVRMVRNELNSLDQDRCGPVVVHCSDGALKTGMFIAIDKVLSDLQNESFVDIMGLVYKMKLSRQVLISTENQYKLIYETVRDYLLGKFNEPDSISNVKISLSTEYLNEEVQADPTKRNTYFNPALADDSSSDSSSSLTDSEDDNPTAATMKPMNPTNIPMDDSSSASDEPF